MPEQLWFTEILNHLFAGPVTGLLQALHIDPEYPASPHPQRRGHAASGVSVSDGAVLPGASPGSPWTSPAPCSTSSKALTVLSKVRARKLSDITARASLPFLMTLAFFILICNLIGLIPGFESPTAEPVVPLGCAVCAFVYYQTQGFKHHGIAYLKHFMGPMWWLAILMFPIEIFSHLARMLSLTVRLFANMFAGDMVTWFFSPWCRSAFRSFSGASYRSFIPADVYLRPADHGVPVGRGSGRALRTVSSFVVSGFDG